MEISICKLTIEYWMIGYLILITMPFRTMMNGVDVIVCAIIGIASWKRNEDGTAIKIVLSSIENKQSTS